MKLLMDPAPYVPRRPRDNNKGFIVRGERGSIVCGRKGFQVENVSRYVTLRHCFLYQKERPPKRSRPLVSSPHLHLRPTYPQRHIHHPYLDIQEVKFSS